MFLNWIWSKYLSKFRTSIRQTMSSRNRRHSTFYILEIPKQRCTFQLNGMSTVLNTLDYRVLNCKHPAQRVSDGIRQNNQRWMEFDFLCAIFFLFEKILRNNLFQKMRRYEYGRPYASFRYDKEKGKQNIIQWYFCIKRYPFGFWISHELSWTGISAANGEKQLEKSVNIAKNKAKKQKKKRNHKWCSQSQKKNLAILGEQILFWNGIKFSRLDF